MKSAPSFIKDIILVNVMLLDLCSFMVQLADPIPRAFVYVNLKLM